MIIADLNTAVGGTSTNSNSVATLRADPDMETLPQKSNELRAARRREESGT